MIAELKRQRKLLHSIDRKLPDCLTHDNFVDYVFFLCKSTGFPLIPNVTQFLFPYVMQITLLLG